MEKLVVIAGTNASGKSGLGIELALRYDAEIVSADSRQVFRGLDLGSGKVTPEETRGVVHHLIDVVNPNDSFALTDFQHLAYDAIDDIHSRGKKAFMVGGTGLYVNCIVDGYQLKNIPIDSEIRERVVAMSIDELKDMIRVNRPQILDSIDIKNKRRLERACERILCGDDDKQPNCPRYDTLTLGVTWPRPVLYERIKERLDRRLDEGMIEEVKKLRENGATDDFLYKLGLEYRYILMYLRGEFKNFDAFYDKLFMEIRHLAREQMTWFNKRTDIHWIDMTKNPTDEAVSVIDDWYNGTSEQNMI
ncbi:MAG: tRNA (adenosine(37)-N6)-dimethylallyltransferase MiaA [Clostridia bacterium]|nr:tRNA (adenosine(37)-N6)-dimethylallyltransferase MiaA [Clostridia bacterium]